MFWRLPPKQMMGILNGMEDDSRPQLALPAGSGTGSGTGGGGTAGGPDELAAFFKRKRAAKLAFQEAKGLQVGRWQHAG